MSVRVSVYEMHNGVVYETCKHEGWSIPVAYLGPRGWRVAEYRALDADRDQYLLSVLKDSRWDEGYSEPPPTLTESEVA